MCEPLNGHEQSGEARQTADQPAQSFHESLHTVALDLNKSSSPLSIVESLGVEEPSRSDDRLMAAGEEANGENVGVRDEPDHPIMSA